MRIDTTVVLVPKTAADFDNLPQPAEDQVWLSGKGWDVEPIPKAHPMNEPANDHFWRSVLRADAPHVFGAALR